jgi:hypothetical protein
MSKKNIKETIKLPNGRVHLVFETHDGTRTYEFQGSSARAVLRGTDPHGLVSKLIEHKKKDPKK